MKGCDWEDSILKTLQKCKGVRKEHELTAGRQVYCIMSSDKSILQVSAEKIDELFGRVSYTIEMPRWQQIRKPLQS